MLMPVGRIPFLDILHIIRMLWVLLKSSVESWCLLLFSAVSHPGWIETIRFFLTFFLLWVSISGQFSKPMLCLTSLLLTGWSQACALLHIVVQFSGILLRCVGVFCVFVLQKWALEVFWLVHKTSRTLSLALSSLGFFSTSTSIL